MDGPLLQRGGRPPCPRVRAATPPAVRSGGQRTARDAAGRRFGQGWVTSGLGGDDRAQWWERIATLAARFDDVAAGAAMDRYLVLDSTGHGPVRSAAEFVDEAGRAGELGFTDVVIHWPRPGAGTPATRRPWRR